MEDRDLHQKAVLWTATGKDDYGQVTVDAAYASGAEVSVRWEEGRRESLDANGNRIGIDGRVAVDREIAVGSILWLGAKDDLPDAAVDLRQVVNYKTIPDVKNRASRRTVEVIRFGNTFPAVTA